MTQGLKPRMTYAQYLEAVRCHEIHTQTPTLSDLARQWGIPTSTVIYGVRRKIKRYEIRKHKEQNNET